MAIIFGQEMDFLKIQNSFSIHYNMGSRNRQKAQNVELSEVKLSEKFQGNSKRGTFQS